ncbi:uncharacterized protein LOC129584318 [Paramacrobiotus metropolitanus]|uniref:uncharacterized protein LOC129584318 n=1 Tax=Paramacrobiotus metropolitanus TaxID=2943436 RepID=UPI0024464A7D|nr:uncharacterized protein LOC129584318 [Paramacrobiotus metropolitanus]
MLLESFTETELDLLVLAEPLACVMHAYTKFPSYIHLQTAIVYGGGPIGALHLIEIGRRFPKAQRYVIEPNKQRRQLLRRIFPEIAVLSFRPENLQGDLTVVATSAPQASVDAVIKASDAGFVVLFSGINHKTKEELPLLEGIDLEAVHRNEEVRVTDRAIRLVGSSGYHESDIENSVQALLKYPHLYSRVQTGIVDALDSKKNNQYVIESMLNTPEVYEKHLKFVFRVPKQEKNLAVFPNDDLSKATVRELVLGDLSSGMVRVRILRACICQTDRRVLSGTKACCGFNRGTVLGHEGIGVVEQVGNQQQSDLIGRAVVVLPHHYVEDPLVDRGLGFLSKKLKHLGIHQNGVFATRIDVPDTCVHVIERDVEPIKIQRKVLTSVGSNSIEITEKSRQLVRRVNSNFG